MIAMSSYLTDTISIPEVIWTSAHALGLFANIMLLRMAALNLGALRRLGINSIREYAAISSLISEALRVLIQFIFFSVGVVSLFIRSQNAEKVPAFQWVLTIAFLVVAFMLVGASWIDKWRRENLIKKIVELEDMASGNQPH